MKYGSYIFYTHNSIGFLSSNVPCGNSVRRSVSIGSASGVVGPVGSCGVVCWLPVCLHPPLCPPSRVSRSLIFVLPCSRSDGFAVAAGGAWLAAVEAVFGLLVHDIGFYVLVSVSV